MSHISENLRDQIRSRFAQIDHCLEPGKRIFFKNARGALTDAMIHGTGNLSGLAEMEKVTLLGRDDNSAREGPVSLRVEGVASADLVKQLNDQGIRTDLRRADHYSGSILTMLGNDTCVRVSMCHYKSVGEVAKSLAAIKEIAA